MAVLRCVDGSVLTAVPVPCRDRAGKPYEITLELRRDDQLFATVGQRCGFQLSRLVRQLSAARSDPDQASVWPDPDDRLPGRPPTVTEALPLLPGVVRVPGGGLVMSAAGEHRSALMVNSADVTDPATGQFGLTVPIDSVETMNVYQTAFLAEYGRFTAGLVSVATRRGGDKW